MQAAVELVRYTDLGNGDIQVQVAVNGILAPAIDDHKSTRELPECLTDKGYLAYIARQSEVLIHIYGDARNPLPMDEILKRQEEGF
jgi:hypothetical protein